MRKSVTWATLSKSNDNKDESDMGEPKYHHYVSAGYLKGFAKKKGDKHSVHCFNIDEKNVRPQSVRKVAGENHFFRIDEHSDPNVLEKAYDTEIESPSLAALKRVCELRSFSNTADREAVLLLVSLFAARNPRDRKSLAENIQPLNKVLTISALGQEGLNSLEAAAALEMNTTKHSLLELSVIGDIHQCLLDRKWVFLQASDDSAGFITSDYPVNLIPHPSRTEDGWGLGFALKDVSVFIPLNRNLAILGDYYAKERLVPLAREAVAAFNSRVIRNATRQVYSYNNDFEFFGPKDALLTGADLPNVL